MKVQIVRIADRGVPTKERLHLRAEADVDIGQYLVFHTGFVAPDSTNIATPPKHVFWFRASVIKAGDNVVLYTTRVGLASSEERPDGGKNHFFYWGLPQPVWADQEQCATVLEIKDWATTKREVSDTPAVH